MTQSDILQAMLDNDAICLLPEQWEKLDGVKVVDPDGWRDGTDWAKPICKSEWERRKSESTICPTDRFNAQFEEWQGNGVGVGCD